MTEFANNYSDFFIDISPNARGNEKNEVYVKCPVCTPHRQEIHQKEKKLAVNIVKGVWRCVHCDWTGGLTPVEFLKNAKIVQTGSLDPPTPNVYKFFQERKISPQTVDFCGTRVSYQSIRQKATDTFEYRKCISFVYRRNGLIKMVKFRDKDKNWKIAKDSTLVAWGLDNLKNQKKGLITEGEIDAMSYVEAGFKASTSVPNGSTISEKEKQFFLENHRLPDEIHMNLGWLDNCYSDYDELEVIYICTDDDPAGIKLRMELGRRLGYDRCRIVRYNNYTYQKEGKTIACKDANEVLMYHGPEALLQTLEDAQPFPINDVILLIDVRDQLDYIYHHGIQKGRSTGYPVLDPHFTWSDGHFIILNGYPGMGKTALALNFAILSSKLYNTRFGVYCPENYPIKNAYSLAIEIYGGNTLDQVPDRMDWAVYNDAIKFINEHIEFVNSPKRYTAADLRDLSARMIKQRGINGFITDPWNSLKHPRITNYDQYLEDELSEEQQFAIATNTIRLVCVHPHTPIRDKNKIYPAPSPHEAKGGEIWFTKGYEFLCSHINKTDPTNWLTELHVQKVKYHKETGIPTPESSPVMLKFVRRSNQFIQEDGFNPFTANANVEKFLPLDLTF